MRKQTAWIIFIGTAALLTLLFLWPIWRVISGGYFVDGHFTWKYLAGVFDNPIYAEGLWNSLFIGLGTTSLTILLALPLAWLAHRYDFSGKTPLAGLLLVPMILPPFVGAIGFQQILG
ncbi:MAG: iron ABC transporter permease, partial [Lentisphaerota bacterium]